MPSSSPRRPERLMLLDAASMYFRTFYGVPDSVRSPDGMPVNAVRGFLDAVSSLLTRYSPTHLVAVFDADWRPQFRVDLLPSYKAHRVAADGGEEVPDTLSPQVPVLIDVLDAIGVARCELDGYEADDVIGTLATRSSMPVDVVTGDRDLFQLVDDARGVRVLYTAKGFGNLEEVDEAAVLSRYGVPARYYADFAALRGDPSDGLPGVPGVGEKSAAAVVNEVGGIDEVLVALADPDVPLPFRGKLAKAREYLAVAPAVVAVQRSLVLPDVDASLPAPPHLPRDLERVATLAQRFGLERPVERLVTALAALAGG
jgi:5'-3' exonuclease